MNRILVIAAALIACGFARAAQAADAPPPQELTTTDGQHFGIWPAKPTGPAPTLFILSATWEDALGNPTYRKAGTQLAARGYLCVSIDLPCHGEFQTAKEKGLTGWRVRVDRNEDVVAEANGRLSKVLDFLIAEKLTDPARVAVCGTSRGGFLAIHWAAADPRVRAAVGYSPVTDLAALSEFRGAEESPLVKRLALVEQAEALQEKPVWMIIGDRDVRVDTDRAIATARKIAATALANKLSPRVDLHVVSNPLGHTTPDGAAEQSALWIDKQLHPPAAKSK